MSTDRDWERWGATNAYFGVVSRDKFRQDLIDEAARADFFASGEKHVAELFHRLESRNPDAEQWIPTSCLDFGCGVGRLLLPMAQRVSAVAGVDVSKSMLAECSRNAQARSLSNVTLVSRTSEANRKFSLVHSFIVFQHIPWQKGRQLLRELAVRVEPGGCLAVHLFTSCHASKAVRAMVRLRYTLPPLQWAWNVSKRKPVFEPPMQLNVYDIAAVTDDLLAAGFREMTLSEESTIPGFRGIYLFAWKGRALKSGNETRGISGG